MLETTFRRYLPLDIQETGWGWSLIDAGRQKCLPQADYPPAGHPHHYLFDNGGRRTLNEYQIVVITEGSGWFESSEVPKTTVGAGVALLLFPGHWHRYRPDSRTGWSERWLGFRGAEANRVVPLFFSPSKAVFTNFDGPGLLRQMDHIMEMLREPIIGREQILASHVPLALAYLRSKSRENRSGSLSDDALVAKVKVALAENPGRRVELPGLARKLGVSYSRMRFAFREQTGHSPREYENKFRLNHACDLLRFSNATVSEIAARLGYSSPFYFSRAFKKQFGRSPRRWKQAR